MSKETHQKEKCGEDCDQCLKGGMPMKKEFLSFVVVFLLAVSTALAVLLVNEKRSIKTPTAPNQEMPAKTYQLPAVKQMTELIDLPESDLSTQATVGEVMADRRSRRTFAEEAVRLEDLTSILLASQGVTDSEKGYRAAPSAKGAYPYTLYVVARDVAGLDSGLYEYLPEENQLGNLEITNAGDLLNSAGVQDAAQKAPAVIVLAAAPAKMVEKFPDGDPMGKILLEGGHIGQNAYLMAEDLEMSMVVMAGFDSTKVGQALSLDENEEVIYLMPIGNRVREAN